MFKALTLRRGIVDDGEYHDLFCIQWVEIPIHIGNANSMTLKNAMVNTTDDGFFIVSSTFWRQLVPVGMPGKFESSPHFQGFCRRFSTMSPRLSRGTTPAIDLKTRKNERNHDNPV